MNEPKGWQSYEVIGFTFPCEQEIDTPRGKARLHHVGLAPQFTKWSEDGFPSEWSGSRFWRLIYADGSTLEPNEQLSAAQGLGEQTSSR